MNVAEKKEFGKVTAYKLGYGPIGQPLMCVHFYVMDGLVIDSGQHHLQRTVLEMLSGHTIYALVMTHHHEDHSGNAAAIAKASRTQILGHPETAAKMGGSFPIKPYQRYVWGHSDAAMVAPLPAFIESDHYRLKPIHCPGHSRDHTVFLEPEHGWLFSGDLYLGERIKFFRSDEIFADQITSIKKVLTYDFDALFCAHNPCPTGGRNKLKRKLQFLEDLYGQVQQMKMSGQSVTAVVAQLDQKRDRLIKLITMGNVSFANMIRSAYHSTGSNTI